MSVIFLFIDGVGLGKEDKMNPFFNTDVRGFTALAGEQNFSEKADGFVKKTHLFKKVDATLGVEGLPQSGTGQTTLLSGKNAAKEIGRHFGPFPHSGIKYLLEEESLFLKAQKKNKKCHFINAYPDIFFRKAEQKNRWSCTTLMTKSANISLNTAEEIKKGKALTAELTQKSWKEQLQIEVPEITPEEAAIRIINQSVNYDLLLHEYYLTDKAGHSQDKKRANQFIHIYDRFLRHLIKLKPATTSLVLCSDHGNVENLSIKTHTYNAVPLVCLGPGAPVFSQAQSIQDVTPGMVKILEGHV